MSVWGLEVCEIFSEIFWEVVVNPCENEWESDDEKRDQGELEMWQGWCDLLQLKLEGNKEVEKLWLSSMRQVL